MSVSSSGQMAPVLALLHPRPAALGAVLTCLPGPLGAVTGLPRALLGLERWKAQGGGSCCPQDQLKVWTETQAGQAPPPSHTSAQRAWAELGIQNQVLARQCPKSSLREALVYVLLAVNPCGGSRGLLPSLFEFSTVESESSVWSQLKCMKSRCRGSEAGA